MTRMSCPAADIFRQAASLNRNDPRRCENVIELETDRQIIVAGDIHGYREGLARIISYATSLPPGQWRLVLQELIHGPADPRNGHDRSIELLLRAARLKVSYPAEAIIIMGNHDIAQVTGNEITKEGCGVCKAFVAGVEFTFGADSGDVIEALYDFLLSAPLAVRCPNGVWITHSLPSTRRMEATGTEILSRPICDKDLRRGGAVYEWTWGRRHSPKSIDTLAEKLGVEFFILGHQPAATGCCELATRGIILASDHKQGCIVHFSTAADAAGLTNENIRDFVKPISGLGGE